MINAVAYYACDAMASERAWDNFMHSSRNVDNKASINVRVDCTLMLVCQRDVLNWLIYAPRRNYAQTSGGL